MFEIINPYDTKSQRVFLRVPFAWMARAVCLCVSKWDWCHESEPWLLDKSGN